MGMQKPSGWFVSMVEQNITIDFWPADDEDVAFRLAEAWHKTAADVRNGATNLDNAAGQVVGVWGDEVGQQFHENAMLYGYQYRELAKLFDDLGVFAHDYGVRIQQTKDGIMDELVKGNLAVDIPFVDRTNEVGRIARSLQVFKDHLVETARLRTEQEAMKVRSVEERRTDLSRIADEFERSIGGVIRGTTAAADELQNSASSMSTIAVGTTDQSAKVAAAAEQTASNVQTVAASAEQLSSSIQEISRQVTQSSSIAQNAVGQAKRTEAMVGRLVEASPVS